MDESIWLNCANPAVMLEYLFDRATDRKLRLFACACCRRYWRSLTDRRGQQVIEAGERFADGRLDRAGLEPVIGSARVAAAETGQFEAGVYNAAVAAAGEQITESVRGVVEALERTARWLAAYECVPGMNEAAEVNEALGRERQEQCDLLREIFGNPFRFSAVDPQCLAWNDGCIPKMARLLYDERRFAELPILADALLDAGCQDEDVLAHLRSGSAHYLGCWALDALLGNNQPLSERARRRRRAQAAEARRQRQAVQEQVYEE
jgi:hypothetical protein